MSDQEQVWTAVAQQLRDQLTEAVWYSTFQDVVPLEANGDHLRDQRAEQPRPGPHPDPLPAARAARRSTTVVAPGCALDIVVDRAAADDVDVRSTTRRATPSPTAVVDTGSLGSRPVRHGACSTRPG